MNDKKNLIKHCDVCYENSTCLCFKCNLYFCESCYKLRHNKQNNTEHKKENIENLIPINFKCKEHPEIPLNLFCVDEEGN